LRVTGKVTPETLKPVPVTVAALTVRAAVPEEVRVTVCAVGVLTATLPKLRLDELTVSVGTAAFSCRVKVGSTLPALAVSVTVCAAVTAEMVAEKAALVAPAAMFTEAGTTTDELLLARLTVYPPLGAAAFSATVQASVPAPVIEPPLQLSAVNTAMPVPLSPIAAVPPVDELLVRVS